MTTLVTSGTGKTGRRVADRLTALGLPVRIGSRSSAPPFDWADRSTWPAALDGVSAVYLAYYPDLAFPGAYDTVKAFTELAVHSGARRIVLLSGRGEPEAQASERTVQESGAQWTIVRCSWFMQNFSEDFLLDAVREGVIALPVADVPEPFVDVDDIADVAAAALSQDGHAGKLYEMTGPRLLTFAQVAEELSRATGRQISFVRVTPQAYVDTVVAHGLPRQEAEGLSQMFTGILDGRNASVADGVRQALGRPARDFADFAKANAKVWAAQASRISVAAGMGPPAGETSSSIPADRRLRAALSSSSDNAGAR
ncbi:NmrA family transcriptional regulator [Nonomuraea turkmeniaca]|uniref:NmrA family transcriptional regulator n=1 Tax=Nonomuraea turkmeniaca TaxID=103838 RepID=A0A5S4EUB1_9ACTN|nr:NmrA family NAD(P)-binding protein [Nonomuraea turkmeniaca]TMR03803.1 NmrA family transcriptional regulator [Nonomuraea turkmeniaca]